MIRLLRPNVYVKGPDYSNADQDASGGISLEANAVASVGGRIVFTNGMTFSSSNLLNLHFPSYGKEVQAYIADLRGRHDAGAVVAAVESLRNLRVAVVGEAIVDEYIYCDQLGKSGKEPVLAMRYSSREMFAGGSLAVANHAASFAKSVDLVTYLGVRDSFEGFCRESLKSNVRPHFIYKEDSPTIVKRRYVENYLLAKMFEVYVCNDEPITDAEDAELAAKFSDIIPEVDVVIVADFGHGLLTPRGVAELGDRSKFLAVNTQINAANVGFHTISKFGRADFVSMNEGEVRLDARSRRGDLDVLAAGLRRRLNCESLLVTRGNQGSTLYHEGQPYFCPALATQVVDRVGSGDAVLAVTSMCAAAGMPPDLVAFIGNVVGAQAVQIMGNRTAIEKLATRRFIESLLK
jgi:rfaE bifunctional protein kinase chain/domain